MKIDAAQASDVQSLGFENLAVIANHEQIGPVTGQDRALLAAC